MSKRTYSWNAYESELLSGVDGSSGTITVTSAVGLQAPAYLVIDPDDNARREYVRVTNIASNVFTVTRGLGGSVGGVGQAHDSGAKVRAVAVHQWLDDIFDDIEANTSDIATNTSDITIVEDAVQLVDANLSGHIVNPGDPHAAAGYLKNADVSGVFLPLAGGTVTGPIVDSVPNTPPASDGTHVNRFYVDDLGNVLQAQIDDNAADILALQLATVDWDDIVGKPTTFTPSAHTHAATEIVSGTLAIARIPTGTSSSTVALGNHTHPYLPLAGGTVTGGTTFNSYVRSNEFYFRSDTDAGMAYVSNGIGSFRVGGTEIARFSNNVATGLQITLSGNLGARTVRNIWLTSSTPTGSLIKGDIWMTTS